MEADLVGTVESLLLPKDHGLWPIFEAIHNSFDAVAERRKVEDFEPLISIVIERRSPQLRALGMGAEPLSGAVVGDNGIGLTDDNWEAFNKLYTRRKAVLGGKGVGRLTWLKAFQSASVESTCRTPDGMRRRRFKFGVPAGVSDVQETIEATGVPGTTVTLTGLKEFYKDDVNVLSETIARRIVEHFLTYFVLHNEVDLVFEDGGYKTSLRDVYGSIVLGDASTKTLILKGEEVTVRHFLVRGFPNGRHEVRWCARDRIVISDPVTHLEVPGLGTRIDLGDQRLIYFAYVTSNLLTKAANTARTHFSIPEAGTETMPGMQDLRDGVRESVREYLAPLTVERRASAVKRLEEFVEEAPQYRYLLDHYADRLTYISPDIEDRKLEIELAKIKAEVVYETREQARRILSRGRQPDREQLADVTAAITATQRSDLAGYVAHRRIVLDLMRAALKYRNDDQTYPYEKEIHKLIFPMRADSNDLTGDHEQHNLWLVDERLAFYSFICSDKEFKHVESLAVAEEGEDRRADLIALDKIAAFGFGDELALRGITLIEFKRAEGMETNNDDPVARLIQYTRLVRGGQLVRPNGLRIGVPESIPIYAFAICNITPTFQETLEDTYKATRMADGSWLLSREQHRLQVHVVPFTELVLNAEKRNAVFFDRAGLPSTRA